MAYTKIIPYKIQKKEYSQIYSNSAEKTMDDIPMKENEGISEYVERIKPKIQQEIKQNERRFFRRLSKK